MDESRRNCPQCREPYSIRLPDSQTRYTRCGLPLSLLQCGHGVCYNCVVSKRALNRNGPSARANDVNTFCCAVCSVVSTIQLEALRVNVLAAVNCYQLGLVQLEELSLQIEGTNLTWRNDDGGLFIPKTPEKLVERPTFAHPGTCQVHQKPLDFWCYDDELHLCSDCRILSHVNHEISRITEKNEDQLKEFYTAVDETVGLVDKMKETSRAIEEKAKKVKSEYNGLSNQVRKHFSDLHAILAVKEQEIHQQLFQSYRSCTSPLKVVQRHMNDLTKELYAQLEYATMTANSCHTNRASITNQMEFLRKLTFMEDAVHESGKELEDVKMHTTVETVAGFSEFIGSNDAAVVRIVDERSRVYWAKNQELYAGIRQDMTDTIVEAKKTRSPRDGEVKRARKELYVDVPIFESQATVVFHCNSEISIKIVCSDVDKFYVHIQGESIHKLEQLQVDLQRVESLPIPRLSDLNAGQAVAGRYAGQWYRALVEEVNEKCDDALVYFVDYGNRELMSVVDIRMLDDRFTVLPAQAVRCAMDKGMQQLVETLQRSETKIVKTIVDMVEPGQVGRLGGRNEILFWLTLIEENKPRRNANIPKWMAPFVDVSEELGYPSIRYESIPMPPPPSATSGSFRKKRFPASKSSSSSVEIIMPPVKQQLVQVPTCPPHEGQENLNRIKVRLIHVESPGQFYVRLEKDDKFYQKLCDHLNKNFVPNLFKPEELTVGLSGLVRADDKWNRCKILDVKETVKVFLMDVGKCVSVPPDSIHRGQPWNNTPPTAVYCRLWGVRPAGGTNWSRTSADKMLESSKKSRSVFIQDYLKLEEEMNDGSLQSINYVRFYYEYVEPGGPLECDKILTGCVNDDFLEDGLALKHKMEVNVQPKENRWLPSLNLPPEFEATPQWIDDEGFVHLQRATGPFCHVPVIAKLLNWFYSNSPPVPEQTWEINQACVAKYSLDQDWCRATVLSLDEDSKTASVLFVDYGNRDEVPLADMRQTLICFEYPVQSHKCKFAKYPGPFKSVEKDELDTLHRHLANKKCVVRVDSYCDIPVIAIRLSAAATVEMDAVFNELRPHRLTSVTTSPSPPMTPTPGPSRALSSADSDDSIFDVGSSQFSDDVWPIFNYDDMLDLESQLYQLFPLPELSLLPIKIVRILAEELSAFIQPTRHSPGDSPSEWQQQVDSFARLDMELQRSALFFVDIEIIDHGAPCACYREEEDRWYRGIVQGYSDDSLNYLRVELVDIGINLDLPLYHVKQLPIEYLAVPRNSIKVRLIDYPIHPIQSHPIDLSFVEKCIAKSKPLFAFFKKPGSLQITLMCDYKEGLIPLLALED